MSDYMNEVYAEAATWSAEKVASIEADILRLIDESTDLEVEGTAPWPGLPVGHLPLMLAPVARGLVDRGVIEEVSRPRVVDPTRLAYFYRRPV